MELSDFWEEWDEDMTNPVPVTDRMIADAERVLGHELPASYVELVKSRNGGKPTKLCFPTDEATSWAEDHIQISGICGIGGKWGIDSDELGSRFMIREWGYPDIGIVVAQCPSAGHDAVMLDYSECGPRGEPRVVHVEVEGDEPVVTLLADDFGAFIEGLVDCEEFEDEDGDDELQRVERGTFSALLRELCAKASDLPRADQVVRSLATRIVEQKGDFMLHDGPLDDLMYDLLFWLYTNVYEVPSKAEYVSAFRNMILYGGGFSLGGFAEAFLTAWFDKRVEHGAFVSTATGKKSRFSFTSDYAADLLHRVQNLPAAGADSSPSPAKKTTKSKTKREK